MSGPVQGTELHPAGGPLLGQLVHRLEADWPVEPPGAHCDGRCLTRRVSQVLDRPALVQQPAIVGPLDGYHVVGRPEYSLSVQGGGDARLAGVAVAGEQDLPA